MKKIVFLILSIVMLMMNFAFASIEKDISSLKRVVNLSVDGKTIQGGFLTSIFLDAYYLVPDAGGDDVKLKISRPWQKDFYTVSLIISEDLYEFNVKVNGKSDKTYKATKTKIEVSNRLSTDNSVEYFYDYKPVGPKTTVDVKLTTPISGTASIAEAVLATGPVTFNPCDGCEHSDQFMLADKNIKVNIVTMNFGEYYKEDCSGEVQRLLNRLLDDGGLAVPFTFSGLVNMASGDYIDQVGEFWTADKENGAAFIGYTTKMPVTRFLDSMINKVADTLKLEAHDIWDDVLKNGDFQDLKGDILTFTYKNVSVKTDLRKATTAISVK